MTRLHIARLKKITSPKSWETAQRAGRVRFCFNFLSEGPYRKNYSCRSSGCLIGELPAHFPTLWAASKPNGVPVHKDGISAQAFFGLTNDQYFYLLEPATKYNTCGHIGIGATREEVIGRIRVFIESVESLIPGRPRTKRKVKK